VGSTVVDIAIMVLLLILIASGWLKALSNLDKKNIKSKELQRKKGHLTTIKSSTRGYEESR
jgi:hypothetical protein